MRNEAIFDLAFEDVKLLHLRKEDFQLLGLVMGFSVSNEDLEVVDFANVKSEVRCQFGSMNRWLAPQGGA